MNIFPFVSFVLYFEWAHAFHEILKQPPLTAFLTYPFEGLDYNDMPQKYAKVPLTCSKIFTRCIRYRTDLHPVCAINGYNWHIENFYSPCQVDFMNCLYRVRVKHGFYGKDYRNNRIYFNGEDLNCRQVLRIAGSPEAALRMYEQSLPSEILEMKPKIASVSKGNMNFDNYDFADYEADSMPFGEGDGNLKTHEGDTGFKNDMDPNIDYMPMGIRDEILNNIKEDIGIEKDTISKADSIPDEKVEVTPEVPKSVNKDHVIIDINSVPKDKSQEMIDGLILMNQKLNKLNDEMNVWRI